MTAVNLKVVIAEDDLSTAVYLKKIIEEVPDVEVVSIAGNGKEAIRQVEIHQPDVVFLDIDMPEMNGVEAAQELAEMRPGLYFVFATAYPDYTLEASGKLCLQVNHITLFCTQVTGFS